MIKQKIIQRIGSSTFQSRNLLKGFAGGAASGSRLLEVKVFPIIQLLVELIQKHLQRIVEFFHETPAAVPHARYNPMGE